MIVTFIFILPFQNWFDLFKFGVRKKEMVEKTYNGLAPKRSSKFANAGIPADTLTSAANAAARLCTQSGLADGGTLDPCHFAHYQQLLRELAQKASS